MFRFGEPGKRIYHTSTLQFGTLAGYPQEPDNGGFDFVIPVTWDNGTRTVEWTRNLRLDCETCAGGCECQRGWAGCHHYACWGARDDAQGTCHAVPAHRAATTASLDAWKAEHRNTAPIYA